MSFWYAMKYALYVPGVVGAVMENVSEKVPAASWLVWSTHVTVPGAVVDMLQPVALQLLFPPPLSVVTLTIAVIDAPAATVTLVAPLSVTELMVRLSVNVV